MERFPFSLENLLRFLYSKGGNIFSFGRLLTEFFGYPDWCLRLNWPGTIRIFEVRMGPAIRTLLDLITIKEEGKTS